MNIFFIKVGALLGLISVALGAFGAHAFKISLKASNHFETFETAIRYQYYGAFALIIVGILASQFPNKYGKWAGFLFLFGTLIFSGSLHLICFSGINVFGAIAPIGGICLMLAWVFLYLNIKNSK